MPKKVLMNLSEQTVISGLMCTDKDKDTEQNGRERRKSESSAGKGGVAVSLKQISTYFTSSSKLFYHIVEISRICYFILCKCNSGSNVFITIQILHVLKI